MSGMYTNVVALIPTRDGAEIGERQLATVKQAFEDVWCRHADIDPTDLEHLGGSFYVSEHPVGISVELEGNTEYEISGDVNAVEAISMQWPTATVTIDREWTGEGGPSVESFEFFGGERISESNTQPVRTDQVVVPRSDLEGWLGMLEQTPFPDLAAVIAGIRSTLS